MNFSMLSRNLRIYSKYSSLVVKATKKGRNLWVSNQQISDFFSYWKIHHLCGIELNLIALFNWGTVPDNDI